MTALMVGWLAASAVTIPLAMDEAQRRQQYFLELDVSVSKPTVVNIFADDGFGFRPQHVLPLALEPSVDPVSRDVPLQLGTYWGVRLEPADAGTIVLRSVRIIDRDGRTIRRLKPDAFRPSESVSIAERTDDRLVAAAMPEHGVPQLTYLFDVPVILMLTRLDALRWAGIGYLVALVCTLSTFVVVRPGAVWSPTGGSPRRRHAAIAGVAAISALLAIHPFVLGHSLATPNNGPSTFVYDLPPYVPGSTDLGVEHGVGADTNAAMWVTLPYARAQRAAVLAGEFPWWNRYAESGQPLWGQGQSAFLDPLHWISLIDNAALGADLKFALGRFVFATGGGLAAFAASGSLAAALVVTLAAPFIGHFTSRLNDPVYFAIVYAPWILWGYGRLATAATRRAAAGASAMLAVATALVMFASPPKESVVILCVTHAAGITALAFARTRGRTVSRFALAGGALVAAALVTAPHWLIFLETLAGAATSYDDGLIFLAGGQHFSSVVLGALAPSMRHAGLNPVLAAALVVAVFEWRRVIASPLASGCAAAGVAGIAIAVGMVPTDWLGRLPLLPQIHHLGGSLMIAVTPLLMAVASIGMAGLCQRATAGEGPLRPLLLGALVSAVAVVAVLAGANLTQPMAAAGLVAAAWAGALPCLAYLAASGRGGKVAWAAVAVSAAALLLPGGLHMPSPIPWVNQVLTQPRERAALSARPAELIGLDSGAGPFRVAGTNRVLNGGVAAFLSLETITGFEALVSPQTRWLGTQFAPLFPYALPAEGPSREQSVAPLLDFWGVRYRVAATDAPSGRPLDRTERPTAWPRAFFADGVEVYDGPGAFVDRLRYATTPFAAVDARDNEAEGATRPFRGVTSTIGAAYGYRLTPNSTHFTIDAPSAGIVVLGETYWPGVTATLDGRPVPVIRINEAMRAVLVDRAGTWQVTFRYRPGLWTTALWMAAAGAGMMVLLLRIGLRKPR